MIHYLIFNLIVAHILGDFYLYNPQNEMFVIIRTKRHFP